MRQTTKYLTSSRLVRQPPALWTGPKIELFSLMRIFPLTGYTPLLFVLGLAITAAEPTVAAPICATTVSQIENSNSTLLKDMLKLLRNNKTPGLANRSRGSFLRADVSDKLVLAYHSTTEGFLGTEFEYRDGTLEVCDKDGKLILKSPAFGDRNLEVTLSGECFRIEHALARMMSDAATFCPSTMPAPIRVAMESAPSSAAKTRAQLANQ